jgi:hypothetical protein
VLRRIFRPKRKEVTGGWKRLHSEELHNLYASPFVIRVIKPRWMRWEEHVTRKDEMNMHTKFWSVNLKGRVFPVLNYHATKTYPNSF